MISTETGKEILKEIRDQVYKLSIKRYPNINYYIGKTANTKLRQELLAILNYLLNPRDAKNEKGEIEERFFTAFNQYCFYLDTLAYSHKIREVLGSKERSNHGINLLCALGFFWKDKELERYEINKNYKQDYPNNRLMSIYHFKKINLEDIEKQAERLRNAKITVSSISANNLRGAGLADIADQVYFRNNISAFIKKLVKLNDVLDILNTIIDSKGFATKAELIVKCSEFYNLSRTETEKILRAFRKDLEKSYRYGRPRKIDRDLYDYHFTKWIYTRKEEKEDNATQDRQIIYGKRKTRRREEESED